MDDKSLTYEQLVSKLRDDWFKPFRDAWGDPSMDIYDTLEIIDPPTPSAVDAQYADVAQLMTWKRERGS